MHAHAANNTARLPASRPRRPQTKAARDSLGSATDPGPGRWECWARQVAGWLAALPCAWPPPHGSMAWQARTGSCLDAVRTDRAASCEGTVSTVRRTRRIWACTCVQSIVYPWVRGSQAVVSALLLPLLPCTAASTAPTTATPCTSVRLLLLTLPVSSWFEHRGSCHQRDESGWPSARKACSSPGRAVTPCARSNQANNAFGVGREPTVG